MFRNEASVWSIRTVLMIGIGLVMTAGGNAKADFVFGEPTNLGPAVNSPSDELFATLSPDNLSLYVQSLRSGASDFWIATRASLHEPWQEAEPMGPPISSSAWDESASVTADGLELYFSSYRDGGYGSEDIWFSKRESILDPWGTPENIGMPINSAAAEWTGTVSPDGLELYFLSMSGIGGVDIWVTTRASREDAWSEPRNLGAPMNSSKADESSALSSDGLTLFVNTDRSTTWPNLDIWVARRRDRNSPWGAPVNMGPGINTPAVERAVGLSNDGSVFYFASNRYGGQGYNDLWQAPIIPITDFNGDGRVDGKDVLSMTDSWGTDDSLCDIGPTPWGDGVIDIEDLKMLARYIGVEIDDPTLIAHWTLDESEGDIAHDSSGDHDATVVGEAQWRPEGGQMDGALELAGSAHVAADFILDPSEEPFSVLAWIKGGAAGQVVISQAGGQSWLLVDASSGTLATALRPTGRTPIPLLVSDTEITDDTWHRIGLVWDGALRMLYVDDVLVAEDAQNSPTSCTGDMTIGCDENTTPGTFWTGLIDDVRVYNRAVRP